MSVTLASIETPRIEARAGLPFQINGDFSVGHSYEVQVGTEACLSGVSGRPYVIIAVRDDRLIAYLPLVVAGVYDVVVTDLDDLGTDTLTDALTVDPAQRMSSLLGFCRSWGPIWKVDRL